MLGGGRHHDVGHGAVLHQQCPAGLKNPARFGECCRRRGQVMDQSPLQHQVRAAVGKTRLLRRALLEGDRRCARRRPFPRVLNHLGGGVDADHLRGAQLCQGSGVDAAATAQIDHAQPVEVDNPADGLAPTVIRFPGGVGPALSRSWKSIANAAPCGK